MDKEDLLRLRNETQLGINRGDFIDDPEFLNAIDKAAQGRAIEELAGDYFELTVPRRKSDRESGKVFLTPVPATHGMSTSAATYQAMAAAEAQARSGKSRLAPGAGANDLAKTIAFLQEHVMPGSISYIGKLGSRETPTEQEVLERAAKLLGDTRNGFDSSSGMPFNMFRQQGIIGLDAGHGEAHASNPALSNSASNIRFQNMYENRGQAAAEKIAANQGRSASGQEIADMLWKSIVKRTVDDVKLPRKGSAAFKALMGPINAKVNQSRMAGQIFIV